MYMYDYNMVLYILIIIFMGLLVIDSIVITLQLSSNEACINTNYIVISVILLCYAHIGVYRSITQIISHKLHLLV